MATKPARKPTAKTDKTPDPITTINKATCKSLEGKSTLTYHIGIDDKKAFYWKIASNSGGGFFSDEWVPFSKIQKVLKAWPKDKPITSMVLKGLFSGKSVNTPSFLLASLVKEGILAPVPKKKRRYELGDDKPFLSAMDKLTVKHRKTGKAKPKSKPKAAVSMTKAKKKAPSKK